MGVVLGTAAYMAPEQAQRKGRGSPGRRLGLRRVALRDAGGTPRRSAVTKRSRRTRRGAAPGDRLVRTAARYAATQSAGCSSDVSIGMPRQRLRDIGEARGAVLLRRTQRRRRLRRQRLLPSSDMGLVGRVARRWLDCRRGAVGDRWGSAHRLIRVPATARRRSTLTPPDAGCPGSSCNPTSPQTAARSCTASAASGRCRPLSAARRADALARSISPGGSPAEEEALAGSFSPDGERIAFRSGRDGGGLFVMGATGESVRRGSPPVGWNPDHGRQMEDAWPSRPGASRDALSRLTVSELWTVVESRSRGARRTEAADPPTPSSQRGRRGRRGSPTGPTRSGQRDVWTIAAGGRGAPVPVTNNPATDSGPRVVTRRP